MGVIVTGVPALAADYPLGRPRPWHRLGDWVADQVRFTGAWVQGDTVRQAVDVLVHVVTAPRTSGRVMCAPATDAPVPVPVSDPDWVANRTRTEQGGTS